MAQLIYAMRGTIDSGFHIRWRTSSDYRSEIPIVDRDFRAFVTNAEKNPGAASLLFYARILMRLTRRRTLWISTGPESTVIPDLVFFFVLWLVARGRIVLSVRNIERWVFASSHRTWQDTVRRALIMQIPRVVFESQIQRDTFKRYLPEFRGHTSYLPVFFSDGMSLWTGPTHVSDEPELSETESVRLGLLGGVDNGRRDYSVLLEALALLSKNKRDQLLISVLGSTNSPEAPKIIQELRTLVRVEILGGYLTNRIMMDGLSKCNLLIAPLRTDAGYGAHKGTGAIGDAIIAQCSVLMPSGIEVDEMLQSAVVRYDSEKELTSQLSMLVENPAKRLIDNEIVTFFSREVAFGRALGALRLS